MDRSTQTDEQIAAEAAREGSDGPAFLTLLERFRDTVWRICYRILGNAEDANDAAQEVFVRMFLHRERFEGRSRYATWVHSITIRTCLMIRRGRGRRQKHEAASGEDARSRSRSQPDPTANLELSEMLEILDEEERAMLLMKYGEGYSNEELAEFLGISVSACKMRISRACVRLRENFPEQNFGDD